MEDLTDPLPEEIKFKLEELNNARFKTIAIELEDRKAFHRLEIERSKVDPWFMFNMDYDGFESD